MSFKKQKKKNFCLFTYFFFNQTKGNTNLKKRKTKFKDATDHINYCTTALPQVKYYKRRRKKQVKY